MSVKLLERIETNPQIMMGRPIVKGTGIPVEAVLKRLAQDVSLEGLKRQYPQLTEEDVKASIFYAAQLVGATPH
jgi:uncharacterized protein (DUF433 family)